MNMVIWAVGTLNQLLRYSYTLIEFSQKKIISGKTLFFVIGSFAGLKISTEHWTICGKNRVYV